MTLIQTLQCMKYTENELETCREFLWVSDRVPMGLSLMRGVGQLSLEQGLGTQIFASVGEG